MSVPTVWKGFVVKEEQNGPGIPGLRVELSARSSAGERVIGRAVSDREGLYSISLNPENAVPGTTYEIAVIDRLGGVIHRQQYRNEKGEPPPSEPLILNSGVLAAHEAIPISLEHVDGPLADTEGLIAGLSALLDRVVPKGSPRHERLLGALRCPLPSLGFSEQLYGDAWGVLGGDPRATMRFAESLRMLPSDPDPKFSEKRSPCGHVYGYSDRASWAGEAMISQDRALPLMAAAAYLENTGLFGTQLKARALTALCRIERLGNLFRLGVEGANEPRALQQLQGMLELGMPWPECPPTEIPPVLPVFECEPHRICLDEASDALAGVPAYVITTVTPGSACPGQIITIVGTGFGTTPGTVLFGGVEATPITWSATSITVTVSPGAGNPLSLKLPPYVRLVCGRLIEGRPTGRLDATFKVAMPQILGFFAGSRPQSIYCVEPGQPIPVTWRVSGASTIQVQIFNEANVVIAESNPAPALGVFATLTAPNTNRPLRWRARITASGACGTPAVSAEIEIRIIRDRILRVDGMEITQAIQFYRADQHLTDPADRGADNSLRLVADKPAWVRCYLRNGFDPTFNGGPIANVNGTLKVERRTAGIWNTIGVLTSQNGPIAAQDSFASYDAERGNINSTLNFVVPRAMMNGLLRFTLDARAPDEDCSTTRTSAQLNATVDLQQTLNAAFITIAYNGPNAAGTANENLAAPTLRDCTAETAWALTTYPVSSTPNVRVAATFTTATPLNDARSCPGCCSPNWGPLLATIGALVAADQAARPGENWVYYGLIAGRIPVNVSGCNAGATGGLAGQPQTYAHEIGHAFGLPHSRCGNSGMGNAAFPVYEPYDQPVDVPAEPIQDTTWTMASTGEYGLDVNNGNISNPGVAHDFMSYCGPSWISIFTHNFLINSTGLAPVSLASGAPSGGERVIKSEGTSVMDHPSRVSRLIHMMGKIAADGRVEVSSVARLETRYLAKGGADSGYRAQLVGDNNRVLAEDVVYAYQSSGGCGCGGAGQGGSAAESTEPKEFLFTAMLSDVAPGQALRIVKGNETVWERKAPAAPPEIGKVEASVDGGGLHLNWSAKRYSDDAQDSWVRWSDDGGETWNALTLVTSGGKAEVPLEQLPTGRAQFQVLVNDGFFTSAKASQSVDVPEAPPFVTILYPRPSDRAYPERQIRLWAAAGSMGRERIPAEAFVWYIDDREAGRGSDIWAENPGPGHHKVRVEVKGRAGSSSAESEVEIPD